jgi:hypothetical protein
MLVFGDGAGRPAGHCASRPTVRYTLTQYGGGGGQMVWEGVGGGGFQ